MENKNKYRILYNLNHKTAMPFEVELLKRLGFEVFVSNSVPADSLTMRSAAKKSPDLDHGLTIDERSLKYLNEIDFYKPLSGAAMELVNKYFDAVFAIADPKIIDAYLRSFRGMVFLRAYGNANEFKYSKYFSDVIGPSHLDSVKRQGQRFKFAGIFKNIPDVESHEYKAASIWLPLGLPKSYFKDVNTWVGGGDEIVFLAPDILHSSYYYGSYLNFRKEFSDYSYRVLGQQRIRPADEKVLGFVPDDSFVKLMHTAAAYIYPSKEERHLHYTPVEAMVIGMPVIFDKSGALKQLFDRPSPGAYGSPSEAREKLSRLVSGDRQFASAIQKSQASVIQKMSIDWCFEVWKKAFDESVFPVLKRSREDVIENVDLPNFSLDTFPIEASAYRWLHSFDFKPHLLIQGSATLPRVCERADALLGDTDFLGKTVLEIGEGEGAYAVQSIRQGAKSVTTLCVNEEQFEKCSLVKQSLVFPEWHLRLVGLADIADFISSQVEPVDIVIIHGLLNHSHDVIRLLGATGRIAKQSIIFEYWQGDLQDSSEPSIVYTSRDQRSAGYPIIKLNDKAIISVLNEMTFSKVNLTPTPNESSRFILRLERNNKNVSQTNMTVKKEPKASSLWSKRKIFGLNQR